jgi:hypothetical protein
MKVIRQCKCCNATFKARSADVNRGWALFCSKSCKAKDQERNKKLKTIKNVTITTRVLDDIEFTYTRRDLIEKLNKNMVYEWDNSVFENSLQFTNLTKAYNYVLQHS